MVNPEETIKYFKKILLQTHEGWVPTQGYYHYRGPDLSHPYVRNKAGSIRNQLTYDAMCNSDKDMLEVLLMGLFQLGVQQGLEIKK